MTASDPIPTSAQDIQPLLIGASVPELAMETADGKAFNLNAAIKKKPTVVIFYRGGWCPYCNTHLGQLQTVEQELLKLGYQILAISPDRPSKLGESVEKHKLTYTLLSDSSMAAAKAFGIAFRVDDATLEKYKGYGIDLEAASGQTHHLLPVPAVFILGTDGKVKFAHANPDYKTRLAPDDLLKCAQASLCADEAKPTGVTPNIQRFIEISGAVLYAHKEAYGGGIDGMWIGFGENGQPVVGVATRKTKTYVKALAVVAVTPTNTTYRIAAAEIPEVGSFPGKSQTLTKDALKDITGRVFKNTREARELVDAVTGATQYYKAIYVSYALMASKVIEELSDPPDWPRAAIRSK